MIVVLDCNVIVSAGWKDGFVRSVVRHAIECHDIIISPAIIEEYKRVAGYEKFSAETAAYITDVIAEIKSCARMVEPVCASVVLPDPDDGKFVEAAITADADFIVTGNLKHFPDGCYGSTRVISVRGFAELTGLVPQSL